MIKLIIYILKIVRGQTLCFVILLIFSIFIFKRTTIPRYKQIFERSDSERNYLLVNSCEFGFLFDFFGSSSFSKNIALDKMF